MLTECLLVDGLWRHWRCACCVESTAAYRTFGSCRSRFKRPSNVCSLVRSLKRKPDKKKGRKHEQIWFELKNPTRRSPVFSKKRSCMVNTSCSGNAQDFHTWLKSTFRRDPCRKLWQLPWEIPAESFGARPAGFFFADTLRSNLWKRK